MGYVLCVAVSAFVVFTLMCFYNCCGNEKTTETITKLKKENNEVQN